MKKRRIVIASVLKPVDDTRMFEKMAITFAESGQYEVFIAGYSPQRTPTHPEIHFRPLTPFSRISFGRLMAPLKIQKILHEVQADILIVNTHELLIVAALNRILFGVRVVYDIRENYFRNILYSEAFPALLRPFLAAWVRLKEWLIAPFIHRFILAERSYKNEMSFLNRGCTIIENKVKVPSGFSRAPQTGAINLLFSGTLAESTGVFMAIELAKRLQGLNASVKLKIIGYCAKTSWLERIRKETTQHSFIHLVGGDRLVPHEEILEAIAISDFGLIAYPPLPHTKGAIPTKLYEYLGYRLPILLQHNTEWEALCAPSSAALPIDFDKEDAAALLLKMKSTFYKNLPEGISWEPEAKKLLQTISEIFV